MLLTVAFALLGQTYSVFHRSVRCSAFCPSLTFTIEQQSMFCTLVLRSAAVVGGRRIDVAPNSTNA